MPVVLCFGSCCYDEGAFIVLCLWLLDWSDTCLMGHGTRLLTLLKPSCLFCQSRKESPEARSSSNSSNHISSCSSSRVTFRASGIQQETAISTVGRKTDQQAKQKIDDQISSMRIVYTRSYAPLCCLCVSLWTSYRYSLGVNGSLDNWGW